MEGSELWLTRLEGEGRQHPQPALADTPQPPPNAHTHNMPPYPYYTPRTRRTTTAEASTSSATTLHSVDDAYLAHGLHGGPGARRTPRRSRSNGLVGCLYPGATFVGTQRSGQYAYDVTVTLASVDVPVPNTSNPSSSSSSSNSEEAHLCGYLKIKGLTDEHPELTTYFDAEVITPNQTQNDTDAPGFRTPRTWGACEARDWQHWSRFPAFQRLGLSDLDHRPSVDSVLPPSSTTPERAHNIVQIQRSY